MALFFETVWFDQTGDHRQPFADREAAENRARVVSERKMPHSGRVEVFRVDVDEGVWSIPVGVSAWRKGAEVPM